MEEGAPVEGHCCLASVLLAEECHLLGRREWSADELENALFGSEARPLCSSHATSGPAYSML